MYTISLVAVRMEEDNLQMQTHMVTVTKDNPEEAALYAMLFVMSDAAKDFGDQPDAVRVVSIQEGDIEAIELSKEYLDLGRALTDKSNEIESLLENHITPAQMPA